MPPVEFEPTIPASERPQIYALDRAATETGTAFWLYSNISEIYNSYASAYMDYIYVKSTDDLCNCNQHF